MMNNRIKKLTASILSFVIIFVTLSTIVFADAIVFTTYDGEITSKAAFVMDADSSYVLYELNSDDRMYPASLTKVMTAIIVLDSVGGNYDDLVNFSYNSVTQDIDKASVTIGASAGDQLSIKDCLYSLLLASANDVANALAEHIAGSIKDFALLMNEKATNLGCTNTHFVNPSGLHDDNQYTTASDMAKILQYAMTFPIFSQISSSVSYKHAPIRRYKNPENSNNQVLNTNSIMVPGSGYYYNGITSGKTGHTALAGYNIAASARKHNMNIICVLLGGKSDKIRYGEAKSLFDFYFANYDSPRISDVDPRFKKNLGTISIDDVHLVETLDITCADNAHVTIPHGTSYDKITSKITYQIEDIYNKYAIGTIHYYLNDKLIGKCSMEGRNFEAAESIFTGNLDLSSLPDDISKDLSNSNLENENFNNNSLIYRNSNGNLVISKTLVTLFTIVIAMIISSLVFAFLYARVLTNSNFPINKMLFRLKRRFRR